MITAYPPAQPPANLLTSGEEVYLREYAAVTNLTAASGSLKLSYFTCRKTESTTQVRLGTGGVAAGTPTICRVGLYLIDANLGGTLVASTANDTTLFIAANTVYTKSWSSPYTKIVGQRYAVGPLVLATTAPTWWGQAILAGVQGRAETAFDPRLVGLITGLSDLPSTFTNASLSTTIDGRPYVAVLP